VSCCLLDTRGAESTANHSAQPGKLRLVIIMRLTKKGENSEATIGGGIGPLLQTRERSKNVECSYRKPEGGLRAVLIF
jgi:hypothetical protein